MTRKLLLIISGAAGLWCGAALAQNVEEKFSPEYQQAYEGAILQFNRNDFDGALRQLDAAEKLQPGVIATQNLRGAVYVRQKKYADAQQVFAELHKKDPSNVMATFNLGETYFLQKNYADAVKYFQTFAEQSKNQNSLGVYKVFLCNLLTGKESEAKKTLDNTPASPHDPLYYYLNAAWQFKQGKADDARGFLASAFQIYPGQANMAFIDSLIELGYVSPNDLKASGGASAPAEQAAPPPAAPDISGLESLLPSLDSKDKKK